MPTLTSPKVRKKVFKQPHPLDAELIGLARRDPQHRFLTNPSALLIYTYLVEYVRVFSNEWFNGRRLRILDWGAGKGHITYLLKKHYQGKADVVSCDVAPSELARHDSSFHQATPIIEHTHIDVVPLHHPFQLPFDNESFDVVISMGVLEHVPHDQQSLLENPADSEPARVVLLLLLTLPLVVDPATCPLAGRLLPRPIVRSIAGAADADSSKL